VSRAEHVEAALGAAQEAARSVGLANTRERVAAAGQDFVSVRLMTDVPDEPVGRRVERVVQRDGQLDGAEAAGEVPAALGAARDELVAQRLRDVGERSARKTPEIGRLTDRVEQRLTPWALSMKRRQSHPRASAASAFADRLRPIGQRASK
jgi:hypothetical protein